MNNNKFSLQAFLLIFGVVLTNFVHSQCTETAAFGSGTASTVNGTTVTLTTCAFQGEYSTVFGIVAGTTYTATTSSGCVTVHSGTPAGPVVSFGTGSTTFVAPTSGTYYVHYSVNCTGCGNGSTCITGSITTGSGGGGGGGTGCNTNTSICTPGVAGPFTFAPASANPSSCLDYWNGAAAPNYGYIILYITQGGNLNMLVDANATGFLDVSVFDITTATAAPCAALNTGTEIICNYAAASDGCAEFGSNFPGCASEVAAPVVQTGDVLMILVEDWSNTQTNFTVQLATSPGSAQTGPPNPAITPVGPFCTTSPSVQLNAVDMGGTWTGPGVSSSGLFNPATAGVGTHTINYSIGSAPCNAASSTTITVSNSNVPGTASSTVSTICGSGNVPLTLTGSAGTIQWQSSPTSGGTYTNIGGATSATYTATGVSTNTCYRAMITGCGPAVYSNVVCVTVNPIPTINAGADVARCAGQSATLTASGGSTYTWSPGTGLSATTGATVTATPTATTTYTVSGTSAAGCVNTDQVIVTINPLPTISAGADVTICTGQSTTLTASGGSTYSWSPGTGLSSTSGATVTATPASTTTYTVSGTSAAGCVNTDQVVVTINSSAAINAGADVAICLGGSTTLTASGGATYTWSPGTGLSATTGATVTANPSTTTTYTVTGTTAGGCTGTDQVIVTVNPLPTINAGADVSICATQSTTLTATGGSTYTWSPGTGLSATTGATVTANPSATTTYTVSGTSTAGCVSTDQVIVTINTTAVINAGSDVSICPGGSTTLTASGGATYTWSPATGLSATTGATVTASPTTTTTYTVSGTSAAGCVSTDDIIVTVNPIPTIDAGADVQICPTQSTTLTATGGSTYTWSPATGLSGTTGATVTATPSATTTYTVSGTSAAGCVSTDQVIVTINTTAVINAGADVSICPGGSTTLTASGGATYTWSPATGLSATTGATVTANPSTTTTYTVTGTTASGCVGSDQVIVTINPLPTINAGADVAICSGASTTLTATGGSTYTWSPATGLSATTGATVTANPTATTTYTVSGTSAAGCVSTDDVIVTVNPIPTIDAGADVQICPTQSTTLTATGGSTYTWSPATGLSATTGATVTATPASTTTYTVSGTSAAGCVNTDQVIVTVNATAIINAGADVSICLGGSTVLTASGGATYTWSPTTGLSATTGATVTANPSATTTYTVSGTTASGCVGSDQVIVTIDPLPTINAGADVAICSGASTTLTASGGSTYTWSPGTGLSGTTGATVTANPTTTTTYTVSGTSAAGCVNTDDVIVTVNPIPAVDAGADVSVCPMEDAILTASGATTYTWSPATGLNATTGASVTANVATTTTYTVTGTSLGCTASDQVDVIIVNIAVINAGPDQSICAGASTTINVTGAATYNWSPATGLSTTTGASVTANPTTTTTYTIDGTTSSGCTGSDQITITVNPLPTTNAGADVAICAGSSTILTASGADNYTWSPATGLSATNTASVTANPSSTTTYTVMGTTTAGCTFSDQVIVTVNPIPVVNAGADVSICPGASTTLGASGATTYTWSPAVGLSATNISNPVANPATTTTYTVTGTSLGCIASDDVIVTVNAAANINAGIDVTMCQGGSTTLLATGGSSYTWDNGIGVGNGVSVTPLSSTTYGVTGTDINGCVGTDNIIVTINNNPTVNAGADQGVCPGTAVTLSGSGASTYTWTLGGIDGVPFVPVSTATYTMTGTDVNGCIGTDQVVVTVYPNPIVTAGPDQQVCIGTQVTLNGFGASVYTWDNGVTNGTAFTPPLGSTTYTVVGTSTDGCTGSDNLIVIVNPLPTVGAGADQAVCEGASVTLNGSGASTYTWSNGVTNGQSFTQIPGTVNYTVTGTDMNGCINTDVVSVLVNPNPVVSFDADIVQGCTPLIVTFTNTSTGNLNNCSWSASNGSTANGCGQVTMTFNDAGTFDVTLTTTSVEGCTSATTVNNYIYTEDAPIAGFTTNPGQISSINTEVEFNNTSIGAVNYVWDFGDNSSGSSAVNPIHTYPQDTDGDYEIMLIASTSLGCVDTAFVDLTAVEELIYFIPNSFTPDDDQFNQTFMPVFTSGFDPYDYQMLIFNRWGEIVFESRNHEYGWDGTYGVNEVYPCQEGTYTYRIEFKTSMNDERKVVTGHVNLLK